MAKVDRLVWAATTALRVGDYHIGIRSSSPALDAWVRTTFAEHVVDDPDVPPNYSLKISDEPGQAIKDLSLLYRGCRLVSSARDPVRVVQALLALLAELEDTQRNPRLPRLEAAAVVDGRDAVIIPAQVRLGTPELDRRLRGRGLELVDAMTVAFDPSTWELVVPPCRLVPDEARALAAWSDRDVASGVATGRYRVLAWAFSQHPLPSRAAAVADIAARLRNRRLQQGTEWVAALGRSARQIIHLGATGGRADDVADAVSPLFEQERGADRGGRSRAS